MIFEVLKKDLTIALGWSHCSHAKEGHDGVVEYALKMKADINSQSNVRLMMLSCYLM